MTLHNDYQKLLTRGMPELAYAKPTNIMGVVGFGLYSMDGKLQAMLPESYARDLITTHALQWFYAKVDPEACIDRNANPVRCSVSYMLPGDDSTAYDAYGDKLLDAIIAATEHLEPR